jgi:EAL domain-containing protein (putative c-di-GMP-specific phosphodiesterase class I)
MAGSESPEPRDSSGYPADPGVYRDPTVLLLALVPLAPVFLLGSRDVVAGVGATVEILVSIALWRGYRSRPGFHHLWAAFAVAHTLSAGSLITQSFARDIGPNEQPLFSVILVLGSLMMFGYAGSQAARPMLRWPGSAWQARAAVVGFSLTTIELTWRMTIGTLDLARSPVFIVVGGAGAVISLFAYVSSRRTFPKLGRRAELRMFAGSAVFCCCSLVVQIVLEVTDSFGADYLIGISGGCVAASALFLPGSSAVGYEMSNHSERPLNQGLTAMLLAVLVVDTVLVGLIGQNWEPGPLGWVIAALAAVQLVVLAVIIGSRLGTPAAIPSSFRLRSEMRTAIVNDEFAAFIQPMRARPDERAHGYEVLARWQHPRLDLLSAARFVPLIAAEGLLASLDRSMLLKAARLAPLLAHHPGGAPFVTVNLNPRRLQHPGFGNEVVNEFISSGLSPSQLVFEVTEASSFDDLVAARSNVAALRAHGFRFALDDFGVGHSNIGLLLRLDFDFVKFDRSLIEASLRDERGAESIRLAIRSARASNPQALIVAEGVSDLAWAVPLRELGFDLLQGYALGHPAPLQPSDLAS